MKGRTIIKEPIDSSAWSYQVQGGLDLQLTRSIWTQLGWWYLKYDYNEAGFTYKPDMNGPFIAGWHQLLTQFTRIATGP